MESKLNEYEKQRQEVYSSSVKFTVIAITAVIISLIIGVLVDIIILLVVGIIIAIILLAISASKTKKFSKKFKMDVIKAVVESELENGFYDPNKGLDLSTVLSGAFLPKPDNYSSEDYVKGTFNGVIFEMADVNLEERHVTTDSRGNTTVTYIPYFTGRFMIFDFQRELNMTVKVLEKPLLSQKGLVKIETESIDFNEKFKVFATSEQDAFYILTPSLMLKMQELEQKFRGTIHFSFIDGKLFLGINDKSNSFDINIRTKIDDKLIAIIKSQVSIAPAIISEFKLDKSKFNTLNKI